MIDVIKDIACNVRENQVQALSIPPKILEVSVGTSNGTDHFTLLCLEYSGPALKVVHFNGSGHFDRSVGPKCPLHLTKLLSPVPLFCILLTRTMTKHNRMRFLTTA